MLDKFRLFLKAKRPEITLGAGLLAIGAGVIFACNASRQLDDVLDDAADEIEDIRADEEGVAAEKKIRVVKGRCAWKLFRMYALSAGLLVGGTILVGKSHCDMISRVEGASIRLAETTGAFAAYRAVVRRDLGEDADRHFMYDTEPYTKEIPAYDDEEGAHHDARIEVYEDSVDGEKIDGGIIFDERSIYYDRDYPENNITFLRLAEEDLERELRTAHYLFDERIMKRLGFINYISADDQVCGHLYDGKGPMIDEDGNKLFELGIFNAYDRQLRADGKIGTRFILYPTSYGRGSTYILDKFEKFKRG